MQLRNLSRVRFMLGLLLIVGVALLMGSLPQAAAQGPDDELTAQAVLGTAFTYQGRLNGTGGPVNGACTLTFRLYDQASGGAQIGSTVTLNNVAVNDGYFSVAPDFGSSPFTGEERFLEIAVNCGSGSETLTPRQKLTAAPYALGLRPGAVVQGANTPALSGIFTGATANAAGLYGSSSSSSGRGVFGQATAASGGATGVRGESASTGGYGVYGLASAASGSGTGVFGQSSGASGYGVWGNHLGDGYGILGQSNSATKAGVWGYNANSTGRGVYGLADSTGVNYGVYGESRSTSGGAGVYGYGNAASGANFGVQGISAAPAGYGVFGLANTLSGTNYGVFGQSYSSQGRGVSGYVGTTTGVNYGTTGEVTSTSGGAAGVYGRASGSTGSVYGVLGESYSTGGIGVYGAIGVISGVNYGVYGTSPSTVGRGVYGYATNSSGANYGVLGRTESATGYGGFFVNTGAGNLLAANDIESTTDLEFRVTNTGNVFADGSYNCGLATACFNTGAGADLAERIDVTEALEPGDVVEIDPLQPGHFRRSSAAFSSHVVGVVSTQPAITMNNNDLTDIDSDIRTDNRPLLALVGQVPVKATTENGAIQPGDLLVASSTPGHAMRCEGVEQCFGRAIGKAMEPLTEDSGVITMFVVVQ